MVNPIEKLKKNADGTSGDDVYNITADMFQSLNYLKFFTAGMKSPRDGKLAVEYKDRVYILSIEKTDAPDIRSALELI